jgi:GAF domain-containing protein
VLHEQNETGEPFDQAVAEYQALVVSSMEVTRPERIVHFAIAMGRLAQCRRPSGEDDSIRLELARKAVKELGKARKSEDLRARERIARADLLVVEGQFKKALSVLADLEPVSDPDSPLLAYETARVRSRAIAGLGGVEEAQRQASLAFLIAQRSGWPHRCAWIVTEFGQTGAGTAGSQGSIRSSLESGGWASRSSTNSGVEGGIWADRVVRAGVDRQRLAALEQMSAAASTVLDPTALVRITLDETIRILGADRAYLFLVGEGDQLIPSQGRDVAGHDVTALTGYSASLVDRVHRTGKPLVVTGTDEGAALGAQSVVLHGLRSILVAPLQLDGRLLGVVYLDSQVATGIFDTGDVGILVALTNHIATSLETARAAQLAISVQAVQRERDLAETLRTALEAMNGALAPKDVLEELLTWALTMSSCDSAWLLLQDGDRIILHGRGREGVTSSASLEVGTGPVTLDDHRTAAVLLEPHGSGRAA